MAECRSVLEAFKESVESGKYRYFLDDFQPGNQLILFPAAQTTPYGGLEQYGRNLRKLDRAVKALKGYVSDKL